MSLASVDLATVQVASTVAEHLCSLIFSQNYFQILKRANFQNFSGSMPLDHALSKSMLSSYVSLTKQARLTLCTSCSYLAMVMHTTYERPKLKPISQPPTLTYFWISACTSSL